MAGDPPYGYWMGSGWPGPYKCPDCGAWWTGFIHKCGTVIATGTNDPTPCTCPKGNYTGDWICGRHNPQGGTTGITT